LEIAEQVGGRVVWLTHPPSSEPKDEYGEYPDYDYEFIPCEAVVIEHYLDKYTLVEIV